MLADEVKVLVNEAAEMAAALGHEEPTERSHHLVEVSAIFDRCRSMFGAIRLLAAQGFGQEALVLVRSMITDSLMLMEVAAAHDKRRVEIVVGWSLRGLANLRGVIVEMGTRGKDVAQHLEALGSRENELRRYAARHGARDSHWEVNEKALSKKHGRDDYVSFRLTGHFVHGSPLATQQRYFVKDDVVVVGGPGAQQEPWDKAALLLAAMSLLYAVEAQAVIMDKEKPSGLDGLRERLNAAAED